jgi:hypothetical protein
MTKQGLCFLTTEAQLKILKSLHGGSIINHRKLIINAIVNGIPQMRWSGHWKEYSIIVFDLQGVSIRDILRQLKEPLKIPSVCVIAMHLVTIQSDHCESRLS